MPKDVKLTPRVSLTSSHQNIHDQPETFIHHCIERQEENADMEENKLELPTTSNGGLYSINFCGPDQKEILVRVLTLKLSIL